MGEFNTTLLPLLARLTHGGRKYGVLIFVLSVPIFIYNYNYSLLHTVGRAGKG